jgi:2-phosphoglycerate kinase
VAKDQACKLQILSAKHPDILVAVNIMFSKFATLEQVREMIERKYHETIAESSISNYKKKHWNTHLEMVCERKAAMRGVAEIVGEDGLTAGVNALLWEGLEEMTVPQLMSFKKVLNDGAKVELMKKQFALYAQEHRQKMKERSESMKAGKGNVEVVEDFDMARRMVEQAKEIFGIGKSAIAPPLPKLLGPSDELPSPEVPAVAGKESA